MRRRCATHKKSNVFHDLPNGRPGHAGCSHSERGKVDTTMGSKKTANESRKPAVKNLSPKAEATIKAGRKTGGDQHDYLVYKMSEVLVSSV